VRPPPGRQPDVGSPAGSGRPAATVGQMLGREEIRPETAWLLDTCWRLLRGDPSTCEAPPAGTEWRELSAMLVTSRTAALLGWAHDQRHIRLNVELGEIAVAHHRLTAARVSSLVGQVDALARAIPAATRVLARKGLHLAMLYPAAGARPLSDADLLIHPDDGAVVHHALIRCGFDQGRLSPDDRILERWDRSEELYFRLATNALPTYAKCLPPGSALDWALVDLATRLLPPGLGEAVDVDTVWGARRAHPAVPLMVMSDEHLIVDLCVNLYVTNTTLAYVHRGRYRRLIPYLDLVVVGAVVDWERVVHIRDGHPELRRPLGFAIGNLCRLFPDAVPADILRRLVPIDDPGLLDRIGEQELPTPYVWSKPLCQRMFEAPLPSGIPATASPI
jgi:hypothetical protein